MLSDGEAILALEACNTPLMTRRTRADQKVAANQIGETMEEPVDCRSTVAQEYFALQGNRLESFGRATAMSAKKNGSLTWCARRFARRSQDQIVCCTERSPSKTFGEQWFW